MVIAYLALISLFSAIWFADRPDDSSDFSLIDLGIVVSAGSFFVFLAALVAASMINTFRD
jgi:hypothetical protein